MCAMRSWEDVWGKTLDVVGRKYPSPKNFVPSLRPERADREKPWVSETVSKPAIRPYRL